MLECGGLLWGVVECGKLLRGVVECVRVWWVVVECFVGCIVECGEEES